MAAVAIGMRLRVVGRFSLGAHRVVAIGAARGRALELAVDMAGFALHARVPAVQREAGGEVIEVLEARFRLAERRGGQKREAGQHHQQECRSAVQHWGALGNSATRENRRDLLSSSDCPQPPAEQTVRPAGLAIA